MNTRQKVQAYRQAIEQGRLTRNEAKRHAVLAGLDNDAPPKLLTIPRSEGSTSDETEIKIYDHIDSWGGYWGISADEISAALQEVSTSRIRLRINSPGGEVLEAVAIYNLFADYDAEVHVSIDSLAASAASFIAMAGDRVTMNRASEMMIHNAWGGVVGDAQAIRDYAEILDRQTLKAARIYQARAGGPVDAWLDAMAAETWYSPEEAVEAGLADDVVALKGKPDPDSAADDTDDAEASNRWDLAMYTYGSRADAPDPAMPSKISTDEAPEAAPNASAAEAADAKAVARQRRQTVDVARARLALASTPT